VARAEASKGEPAVAQVRVFFFDYDLTPARVLTCNGHLEPEIGKSRKRADVSATGQLFWNTAQAGFQEVKPAQAGPTCSSRWSPRLCLRRHQRRRTPDVVLTCNGGPARLLRNEGGTGNHWIRWCSRGTASVQPQRIGAAWSWRLAARCNTRVLAGGLPQPERAAADFRLGQAAKVDRITVYWPARRAARRS